MERSLPECWRDFADALAAGIDRVVLYGPPGTGKTYAGLREGVGSAGAHRLVCTEDMTAADVTGCWMPTASGQFEWLDGAAVRAWRGDGVSGARLVVDEADRAAGDVLALLLAVCDSDGSARFDHPALGEVLTPNQGFSVVMTTNLAQPDELPHALRDRFPVMIEIDSPHPGAIEQLPEDLRDAAVAITSTNHERRTSLRAFFAYARLREAVEPRRAARLAFGSARGIEIADALAIDGTERGNPELNPGPYPELLQSRLDRPGATIWQVESGTACRGDAWTDLSRCAMRVPFGGGEHGRLIRAHELMHARVSPLGPDPFGCWPELDPRAVECAEEFRVNQLLARRGFVLDALRDGSERLSGIRMAEAGDVGELLCFSAAITGTAAHRDLIAGVRRVDAAMAAACRELSRELRIVLRQVPNASLASTASDPTGRPAGFAVYTRQLALRIVDAGIRGVIPRTSRRGRRGARPAPTGSFAPLLLDRSVVLDRFLPGGRVPRRVPAAHGRRVVRPQRLATDPARRIFEARARGRGGIIVVDQSGSMSLSGDELEGLVLAAPGAFVLGYSHEPGSTGVPNAWVLAQGGRATRVVRTGNVGNGVDGPALRFALRRRHPGEPVVWVCDGQVTDSGDHADYDLARECAELAVRHRVLMVGTVTEALALFTTGSRSIGGVQSRLLGRVATSVTSPP